MPDQQQYNFIDATKSMGVWDRVRAARQDPQWRLNVALKQQTLEMNRAQMLDAAAKREIGVRQKQGWAAINSMVASPNFSFDNPESEKALLGEASRYGIPVEQMEPYLKRFGSAYEYKRRLDLLTAQTESGTTSTINAKKLSELRSELADAEASGDANRINVARQNVEDFQKLVFSDTEQGLRKPASEDSLINAALDQLKQSDIDKLMGKDPLTPEDAVSLVKKIQGALSDRPNGGGSSQPRESNPRDPLGLGLE